MDFLEFFTEYKQDHRLQNTIKFNMLDRPTNNQPFLNAQCLLGHAVCLKQMLFDIGLKMHNYVHVAYYVE